MGDLDIWAENGGLIGLIMASLFILIGVFISVLSKKDKSNQHFLQGILKDERQERREVNVEHRETYNRLSDALNSLTETIKEHRDR